MKYKITGKDGKSIVVNIKDVVTQSDIAVINNLIADEEAAISAYTLAIQHTASFSCTQLFTHILEEEKEHLEELKNLKAQIESNHIEDSSDRVREFKRGFAIVVEKYWSQYKQNAYVEKVCSSLDEAEYIRSSLERNDHIAFVIIDCKDQHYIRVS